jgi:hypothetical protein
MSARSWLRNLVPARETKFAGFLDDDEPATVAKSNGMVPTPDEIKKGLGSAPNHASSLVAPSPTRSTPAIPAASPVLEPKAADGFHPLLVEILESVSAEQHKFFVSWFVGMSIAQRKTFEQALLTVMRNPQTRVLRYLYDDDLDRPPNRSTAGARLSSSNR